MFKHFILILLLAVALPAMGERGDSLQCADCRQCADSLMWTASNRPTVGLVLGGGGAKGAAEVGVLRAIEESGVPIDYIAGTSIGSIVGGLYSCGLRWQDLDKLFRSQEWLDLLTDRNGELRGKPYSQKDGVTYVFGFPVAGRNKKKGRKRGAGPGLLHGDQVVALLDSLSGRSEPLESFDSLPIPFRCVAVDVQSMAEVVLDSGHLATAMRASMAIPGAFTPVEWDKHVLVDGGLLNNLPVDVVRAMGADIVIAVDLTQNKRDTRDRLMPDFKTMAGKLIGWLATRPDLKKYNENRTQCDIYINPKLENYEATDFQPEKIDEMISLGMDAGQDALPQLRQLAEEMKRYTDN